MSETPEGMDEWIERHVMFKDRKTLENSAAVVISWT